MNVLDKPVVDTITLDETILDDTASCSFDANGAAWLARCRYCPKSVHWCETCHQRVTNRESRPEPHSWQCRGCGVLGARWQDISYAVPI